MTAWALQMMAAVYMSAWLECMSCGATAVTFCSPLPHPPPASETPDHSPTEWLKFQSLLQPCSLMQLHRLHCQGLLEGSTQMLHPLSQHMLPNK